MLFMRISPYLSDVLLSTFVKSIILLIIAALIQLCLKKLSSNLKHILWLTMLSGIVLIPVCFFVISPDFFRVVVQSGSSFDALRILNAVFPRYNEFEVQIQSAAAMVSAAKTTQSMGLISQWAVICVVLWIAGIMFLLIRMIVGKIGIMKIRTGARFIKNRSTIETVEYLLGKLGIRRNIQVLISSSCRVPFTYRTFKPVILLPSGATEWPGERLRSVLIHELAHVKRVDSFTLLFARIVCSLFWFIPAVWIAYRHLYIEQEKSCDEYAVDEGIEAAHYARHILNVVRLARGRILLTGIFISRGKRKMLEKRILHLLMHDALKILTRKKVFIAAVALCLLLIFPVLVFNPMFAEDVKKKISEKDFWTALSGTWVNTEYLGTYAWFEQKVIVCPDGKWECYHLITDTSPSRQGYYLTVTETWTDSEGAIWCKTTEEAGATRYQLHKISDSGNTWEVCDGPDTYPVEVDKSLPNYMYFVRYRQ
jgi:beta-lactamase regulating signal transducer with metallopeptidase domain